MKAMKLDKLPKTVKQHYLEIINELAADHGREGSFKVVDAEMAPTKNLLIVHAESTKVTGQNVLTDEYHIVHRSHRDRWAKFEEQWIRLP